MCEAQFAVSNVMNSFPLIRSNAQQSIDYINISLKEREKEVSNCSLMKPKCKVVENGRRC